MYKMLYLNLYRLHIMFIQSFYTVYSVHYFLYIYLICHQPIYSKYTRWYKIITTKIQNKYVWYKLIIEYRWLSCYDVCTCFWHCIQFNTLHVYKNNFFYVLITFFFFLILKSFKQNRYLGLNKIKYTF